MKKKSKKPEVDIDDLQLSVHLFPSVVHMYQHWKTFISLFLTSQAFHGRHWQSRPGQQGPRHRSGKVRHILARCRLCIIVKVDIENLMISYHAPLVNNNAEYTKIKLGYQICIITMIMTRWLLLFLNMCVCRWPVKSAEFLLHMLKVHCIRHILVHSQYALGKLLITLSIPPRRPRATPSTRVSPPITWSLSTSRCIIE